MSIKLQEKVPLAEYTTFHVGGIAEYFLEVEAEEEILDLITLAKNENKELTVIGGGSNVLIDDAGLKGHVLLVRTKGVEFVEDEDRVILTAAAGEVFDDIVALSTKNGWWGLENLSHIPGSVGAAPVQNIGAYGVEVESCIEKVEAIDKFSGMKKSFSKEECLFNYRDSFFKSVEGKKWIITSVTFILNKKGQAKIDYADLQNRLATKENITVQAVREEIISIRSEKFPDWHKVGTAGSFFKNPIITEEHYNSLLQTYPDMPAYNTAPNMVKVPLGWILDKVLRLKGHKEGNVSCFEKQALVVVADRGATAKEIENFAKEIEEKVFDKTKIIIEWEVTQL